MEKKQQVYSAHITNVLKAITDAGFVKMSPSEFSRGTEHGCLYAAIKGDQNSTVVTVRHELKEGEYVPSYLETNDVHAEQALDDITKLLNGGYSERQAKPSNSKTEHNEPKKNGTQKATFDRKKGFGCVALTMKVAMEDGMHVAGTDYVLDRMLETPKDVLDTLAESEERMDKHFAVLANGKSTYEETESAMMAVVPYLYEELKKKRPTRRDVSFISEDE
jgi:hypothetical protein